MEEGITVVSTKPYTQTFASKKLTKDSLLELENSIRYQDFRGNCCIAIYTNMAMCEIDM